jgi:hypothetical protein
MPTFDEATVRDLLVRNTLRAITADTSIFERYYKTFHQKLLSLLGQFGAKVGIFVESSR